MISTIPGLQNNKRIVSLITHELRPERLIPNLVAGLIVGILVLLFSISLASLVFAGGLSEFAPVGIVLTVLGAMIVGFVVTVFSSFPETIAAPQEVPAVILALIAASIVNAMPAGGTPEETFLTVVGAIALTAILSGLVFLALGHFKGGNLVRFLPYPVIGGFLAGTGWLLITGGITVMTDLAPGLSSLPTLFQAGMWLRWLPAMAFAIFLLVVVTRYSHFIVMPTMILAGLGLFYMVVWLSGASLAELGAQGWLLDSTEQSHSYAFALSDLTRVNWLVVFGQMGDIAVLILISVVALLLNASGLELVARKDIDLNRELQVVGVGNLICGLSGGLVGFHLLSESTLSRKIGGRGRLVGFIVVALCGGVLFWGQQLLFLFPKLLLGSLLIMLGLSFLVEWVYKAWSKFSRIDYGIIIVILLVIAGIGFLQGVLVGIILTVIFFVINYSRINVVKLSCTSANYPSRVRRRRLHRKILVEKGDEIRILQLQGFIFFGTANNLLALMRKEVQKTNPHRVRFVVLDFERVTGLDSTARLSFTKMIHLAEELQVVLLFTNPSHERDAPDRSNSVARLFSQLERVEQDERENAVRIFPGLDYGLEWCENQILMAAGENPVDDEESLQALFRQLFPDAANLDDLLNYFDRLEVASGNYLMKAGDPPGELFFVEAGQVTAQLEFPDRPPFRLETIGGGGVIGEIGFCLNQPRTAAVVANKPSTIHRLSRKKLEQMELNDPDAARLFHQIITHLLAERLTFLTDTVNALQR